MKIFEMKIFEVSPICHVNVYLDPPRRFRNLDSN
jgi:hypothetical protein